MSTQTDILEQQKLIVDNLELHSNKFDSFINGPVNGKVVTESGDIPTLSGLLEEIRERTGGRIYEINFHAFELERYANLSRPIFRVIPSRPLVFPGLLNGSVFTLTRTVGVQVVFRLSIGSEDYTITFAPNSAVGVVSGRATEFSVSAGAPITLMCVGSPSIAEDLTVTINAIAST